jgi:hypothetical protein
MLQTVLLPWAESAFPQGMDWELHGLSFINLFASLATYQQDPLAARMEQTCLQYMRAWQKMSDGDLAVPGSRLGFTRHAICAEQAAYGYLANKIFGEATRKSSPQDATVQTSGVRDFSFVDFIVQRTRRKFFSFSWKNKFMGMIIPLGDAHDGNPFFTVPIANGFVGSLELTPPGDTRSKLLKHDRRELANGFETTGTLTTHGGRLKQTLKVTSLGERTVLYQDRVVALAEVTVTRERGVLLGLENDEVSGGRRVVHHQDGETVFDWRQPRQPAQFSGTWVNVDDRLGLVVVEGVHPGYCQSAGYDAHMAVGTDLLCGSFSDQRKSFSAGELVAQRIVLVFTEISPASTAALSGSWKIEDRPAGRTLHFQLPEGGEAEVALLPARES